MRTVHQRFEEKYIPVTESGCWLWTASVGSHGYGQLNIDGKPILAHRYSYEAHIGPIPEGNGYHGACVLHRCDVPSCVNPAHLFIGSNNDNIKDMVKKGRHGTLKGEASGRAKITEADVIAILADNRRPEEIEVDYPVKAQQIRLIKRGASWSHV